MDRNSAGRIHQTSLALLEAPGVRIEHDRIVKMLIKAGARAGLSPQVVCFPPELVMECVELAPSAVQLADRRQGTHTVTPEGVSQIWSAPGMNMLRHGEHRPFTSSDMADMARLVEQLPRVDGVFGMSMEDIPPAARDVVGLRIMAENTTKHIRVLSFTPDGADAVCEMRDVVEDSPWFSMGFTAHGPLRWTHLALEIFVRSAKKGIPVTINGEPMAGISGPVTLAGAAAVGNAEILAGLVVNQLLEPARPCVYNLGLAHIFDMRTAIAVTGAPENHLLADISSAMGRFYDIPSSSWVSTESMCIDGQAALEKSIGFFTHLQSRVSLIWGVGQLESEMTISPAQAVIDNEILGYARRFLKGVDVTEQTLAVDVTRDVGIAGDYLSHEHTLEHFRTEFFEPSVLLRRKRNAWKSEGSKSLQEVAEARADELIAKPLPRTLTDEQSTALRKIEESFVKKIENR